MGQGGKHFFVLPCKSLNFSSQQRASSEFTLPRGTLMPPTHFSTKGKLNEEITICCKNDMVFTCLPDLLCSVLIFSAEL